jgi:hypothetical protein
MMSVDSERPGPRIVNVQVSFPMSNVKTYKCCSWSTYILVLTINVLYCTLTGAFTSCVPELFINHAQRRQSGSG